MRPISEHQRVETYRNAPDNVRDLYVSEQITEQLDILHTSFKIPVTFREFSTVIGDGILGFYKISDIPKVLQEKFGLTQETSKNIVSQLSNLLEPILHPDDTAQLTQKTDLQRLAEQFAEKSRLAQTATLTQTQASPEISNPEPTATKPEETAHENVQPLRTMQGDINRIHGYGAYNEALEKEGKMHSSTQDTTLGK